MISKKVLKLTVVYVFSTLFSTTAVAAIAPCEPALVIVRHAEDTENAPHKLLKSGKAHANAYRDNLPTLLDGIGICRPGKFFSSDKGSMNPYNTVKPSADAVGSSITAVDQSGALLTPWYNWGNNAFLSFLMPPAGGSISTLMAVSKQSFFWSKDTGMPEYPGIFKSLLKDANIINYLKATTPSPFNQVYIFKRKDLAPDGMTFTTMSTYIQLYDLKPACRYRVSGNLSTFSIKELTPYIVDGQLVSKQLVNQKVELVLGKTYSEVTQYQRCTFEN